MISHCLYHSTNQDQTVKSYRKRETDGIAKMNLCSTSHCLSIPLYTPPPTIIYSLYSPTIGVPISKPGWIHTGVGYRRLFGQKQVWTKMLRNLTPNPMGDRENFSLDNVTMPLYKCLLRTRKNNESVLEVSTRVCQDFRLSLVGKPSALPSRK